MGVKARPPEHNEIEINIFGPGYGECCVVHFGGGHWFVIDSCVDSETGRPSALEYFDRIGVNPAKQVRLLVASHWHDDHVRGLSSVLDACESAKFCASAALSKTEFLAVLAAYDQNRTIQSGSGTSEIIATLKLLENRNPLSHPIRAGASTLLLRVVAAQTGHGLPVDVWSLSPSHAQFEEFLKEIGTLIPAVNTTKRRAYAQSPNHLSVVTWLSIGNLGFVFGDDLEELGMAAFGWSAIVGSETRPAGRALFFKIPHHGSRTTHHEETWSTLSQNDALCVLTPWNRNRTLPTIEDVERLITYTLGGYSTCNLLPKAKVRRSNAVEKQVKETVKNFRTTAVKTGHVQFRRVIKDGLHDDSIELSPGACTLPEMLKFLRENRQ